MCPDPLSFIFCGGSEPVFCPFFVLLSSVFYRAELKCEFSVTFVRIKTSVETRRESLPPDRCTLLARDLRCCSWDAELLLMLWGHSPKCSDDHVDPCWLPSPPFSDCSTSPSGFSCSFFFLMLPSFQAAASMYHPSSSSTTMSAITCLPVCIYSNTVDSNYSRFQLLLVTASCVISKLACMNHHNATMHTEHTKRERCMCISTYSWMFSFHK